MVESCVQHFKEDKHLRNETLEVARDFLKRFFAVTFLLIPLILLTKTSLLIFGFEDFFFRKYLQFVVATFIFYFSLVFFQHARHEIKMKKYGMMTLVSLAVGAGFLFSAVSTFVPAFEGVEFYLEISTLIWILLFGHYLEARSSLAAGNALQEVAKLLPKKAHLFKEKETVDVEVGKLKRGNIVLVKPGEKVPADGVILEGEANFDESLISGESKPVTKKKDDQVVAGSICLDGSLKIKLERVGKSSTIGQIENLIAEAQKTKPRSQRLADKAAGWLTFIALFVSLGTILVWSVAIGKSVVFALTLGITVLVIACPHALGLAIPVVSTIATSLAVKNGLFLKELGKLEKVKDIDWVVFDKTGTLTKGEFGVSDIFNFGLESEKKVLSMIASLEKYSSHVIGQAILKEAKSRKISFEKIENFTNLAGKGIAGKIGGKNYFVGNKNLLEEKKIDLDLTGAGQKYQNLSSQGKTMVFLADEKKALGLVTLSDSPKKESFEAVSHLHSLNIKIAMLTGDSEKVAQYVARELNIDTYFAEVLPEDKYKQIRNLQKRGVRVMMVGDGVNDAPALSQSDIGVAIGAGTDVAVEAGDIVLTKNNPGDIVKLIILGKKVYRKMIENLLWATGYNVVAIPAAAGLFSPWGFFLKPAFGAILMSLSSVIVVINALRLKRVSLEAG